MDQMRRYVRWWHGGYLSSVGYCFDIGLTVRGALQRFEHTGDSYSGSTEAMSAGNGSLMRLAPVPMYYAGDASDAIDRSADSSRTTHGASVLYPKYAGKSGPHLLGFGQRSWSIPRAWGLRW